MKRLILILLIPVTLSVSFWAGCRHGDQPVYYTKVGFYFEKGRHQTTNYQRGTRVPVNTPVRYLDMGKTHLNIQLLDTGEVVTILNVTKYSRRSMREIFHLMFSPEPTDLSDIPVAVKADILAGRVRRGMTREEVLMCLGYPPRHKTPDLDLDTWIYWRGKVNTFHVHFDRSGRVDWIRD